MLKCKKCLETKDLDLFYKHKEWFMGVMQPCKECKKEYAKSPKYRFFARIWME
jgi:hydrogenase maturation factor HypF (carbamoyltransferase family)